MMYQAVIRARHPQTLRVIATITVYEFTDRAIVERVVETGMIGYQPLIDALRRALPAGSLISTELVMP